MLIKSIKKIFFDSIFLLCFCFIPTGFVAGQVIYVDAAEWDLEKDQIQLEGPWKFHFGDFLNAGQMREVDGNIVNLPYTWTGKQYKGKSMGNMGNATYYTRVVLPESVPFMGFYMPVAFTNYRLVINGRKIGEGGQVGAHAEAAVPGFDPQVYQLPFTEDTLDIVLHISNYDYRKGGQWRTPALGKMTALMSAESSRIQMDMFLIGAILLMGLYHIGSNFPRFKNKESLFFALLCLATVIRLLCDGDYILTRIFPDLPFNVLVKTEFIGFYMAVAMSIRFYQHAFSVYDQPLRFFNFFFYSFLIVCTLTLLMPILYASYLVPLAQILTIITIAVFVIKSLKPALQGDPEIILFMAGMTVMCLAVANYLLNISGTGSMDTINAFGAMFFFLCGSVIIARRFNKVYLSVRNFSDGLSAVNTQLENKVQQRTKELAEKNRDLQQNNQELAKINKEKDGLMHVVAHDLKSPLNRSLGLIEVVETEGGLNETQQYMLTLMKQSNEQGIELIHNILQKYSPDQGYVSNYAPFQVRSMTAKLLEGFRECLHQKNLILHKKLPEEDTYFTSDEQAINRIMENLVSNAVKFTSPGRRIWLSVEINEDEMTIICKDEGPGISREDQELLYRKYQKLSARPTGGEDSTGLGLSIVKDLVDNLEGSIALASEKGQGTTFTVTIPSATLKVNSLH